MMPKSIKWRLQIWYGLILVVVLAGFGLTAYYLEGNRQFHRLDQELNRRAGALLSLLRRPPQRGLDGIQRPGSELRRRQELGGPPFDGPPPDSFPDDARPGQNFRPPGSFTLPPEDVHFFDATDLHGFYFVIRRGEREIARSTNAPSADQLMRSQAVGGETNAPPAWRPPEAATKNADEIARDAGFRPPRMPAGQPSPAWMRGSFRETRVVTPLGETILVGKNVTPELKELRLVAWTLTGIGGMILLLGLAGGWWLVSRALLPVTDISATAVKISAGDLSQRINVAQAESELGQLATVLNSTFARLESAFAQQKQFASDAAHELRTPVTVMLTQTQTALTRDRDAASYKQTVEACQRAAQRMRKLIESLLALARFDAGQEVLNRLRFDFSETVSDCAEQVQPLAEERGVKIILELSPLEMTGDSERLAQVVTNLLTNAIQYNRPEGRVRVKLEAQSGLAALTVADTGQGIAAEDLPRVFGRFYRADQSRTGAGNAGLGLAITKAIIEAHGGTIAVTSEVEAGTNFIVHLPV